MNSLQRKNFATACVLKTPLKLAETKSTNFRLIKVTMLLVSTKEDQCRFPSVTEPLGKSYTPE